MVVALGFARTRSLAYLIASVDARRGDGAIAAEIYR